MKSNAKKIIRIIVLGLVLMIASVSYQNFSNDQSSNKGDMEIRYDTEIKSNIYILMYIYIDDDDPSYNWLVTAATQPWCSGDGSWGNPYIIENVKIDASSSPTGSGIFINNSQNVYFIIRNCTVYNAGSGINNGGIKLENTNNGTLTNNDCSNNGGSGILLLNFCYNNTILGNTVYLNGDNGINLVNYCDLNIISENDARFNDYNGIRVNLYSSNNFLSGNTARNNGMYGIVLAAYCNNNTISGSITLNNVYPNIGAIGHCDDNVISGNIANVTNRQGIFLHESDNNIILGNTVNNSHHHGIHLQSNCDNNTISANTVNNNNYNGIYLQNNCDNNTISGNTANDNSETGIFLQNCNYNNITNNMIYRNDLGILLYQSNNNNVSENTLIDNEYCIFEFECLDNIIENNVCSPPSPTVQEPIFIDGTATGIGAHNWTWAENQPWCSGSGTWSDPYVIENLEISGFGIWNGIEIRNSNVSFIVQDCKIYNSYAGIYLYNVTNSRLIDNNCSNNSEEGIYLYKCDNNTISGNTVNNNDYEGIYLNNCDYNTITGNTANNNTDGGIYLRYCNHNNITGNIANDNHWVGIYLYNVANSRLIDNNCSNNLDEGIYLYSGCDNNTISGNTANNNDYEGIYLYNCDYNTITGNTANNNDYEGIYLDNCDYNDITGNTANDNDDSGIYLYNCDYNTISGNIVNDNYNGIILVYNCDNNTILGNTANDNYYGIILVDNCDNNTISENTVNGNSVTGINFIGEGDPCEYNDLTGNILYNNTIGIYLETGINNLLYENFFLKNEKHAFDDGTDNTWNSTTIGNYWDNHTSPDSDNDGIVDLPYNISGSAVSKDYLPIAEDGAPTIDITSPTAGDVFGVNSPSFNVRIADDYLYEMWYTLDGGLHNYTFTINGTIDQSVWDAMPDGTIPIKFYARDIPGNIGSAEVNIIKDTEVPIIIINSPNPGDKFGNDPPTFEVTITDDNLDTIWYTLNNESTKYFFINNGTIEQTAWSALPDGPVTITFSANDTAGNLASEDVDVTKSIPEEADYFMIVIISIVGGAAIIIIILVIIIKKRKPPA